MLPPVGANDANSTICSSSSRGTGSGLSRRIARIVRMASDTEKSISLPVLVLIALSEPLSKRDKRHAPAGHCGGLFQGPTLRSQPHASVCHPRTCRGQGVGPATGFLPVDGVRVGRARARWAAHDGCRSASSPAHRSAGSMPGGPRIWSPSTAETEVKISRSISVSGPARRAGVAARAISSANPAGDVINRLRQPFGPAFDHMPGCEGRWRRSRLGGAGPCPGRPTQCTCLPGRRGGFLVTGVQVQRCRGVGKLETRRRGRSAPRSLPRWSRFVLSALGRGRSHAGRCWQSCSISLVGCVAVLCGARKVVVGGGSGTGSRPLASRSRGHWLQNGSTTGPSRAAFWRHG